MLEAQSAQVLTQHNDNARTGANLTEVELNVATVASGHFGLLYSLPVDGQIYAQPLYMSVDGIISKPPSPIAAAGGNLFSGRRNLLYVATMHNSVYAFDADDPHPTVLWHRQLGAPVPHNFIPLANAAASLGIDEILHLLEHSIGLSGVNICNMDVPLVHTPKFNINPEIGITSTPAIDAASETVFVVAKTAEAKVGDFDYRLHALDARTGAERAGSPVKITASVSGTGVGSKSGIQHFDPNIQLQRPALLLSNGIVYVAFGSHQDTDYYHGWILAYDAQSLRQVGQFITTPNSKEGGGGIWQSGNGPAADPDHNIYVMTGNGPFGGAEFGDSFLKLDAQLNLVDFFTPKDFKDMQQSDADLGSAGPVVLPGGTLVGGGKKGLFYLLDQGDLGHLEDDHGHPLQKFQASQGVDNTLLDIIGAGLVSLGTLETLSGDAQQGAIELALAAAVFSTNLCGADYHHIHGSPVTWTRPKDGSLVYVWGERDTLRAFKYDTASRRFPSTSASYQSSMKDPDDSDPTHKFMPGGILSISANGTTAGSGVLWATVPAVDNAVFQPATGVLRAFDAQDISHELWCGGVGTFAKFSPPTVANGKVYVATFDARVNVYGLDKSGGHPSGDTNIGGYRTKSSPFVDSGYVYFQGSGSGDSDNRLYKVSVTNPNGDNTWLGGYKTKSSPFVADGYVYFQGSGSGDKDDRLYKVSVSNPNGDNTWLGGYKTKSTPFVSQGYVYFQGSGSGDKDSRLYKVSIMNPNGDNTWLGGYKTKSTPFVSQGYAYFQGSGSGDKDDRLYKVSVTNPNGDNTWLGGYKTKSSPFVADSFVYFQGKGGTGDDDALWRIFDDGTRGSIPGCTSKTSSTPFAIEGRVYFQGTDERLLTTAD